MRIEGDYLVVDEYFKEKKITGHSFVGLIGFDSFKKPGDTLLTMHKIVDEKIDPKWLKRGDFAEKIVKAVYQRDGHNCTTYDKKAVQYDNFDYDNFEGLIDIELLDENTLIEVKSKSMKDYQYIVANPPKQEIYQGLYYGFLRKYHHILMEWIFFDEQTEDEIFNDKKPTTLKNLKKYSKKYVIDNKEMEQLLAEAVLLNKGFERTKKIRLNLISDEMLKKLGFERPLGLEDLPF